MCVLWHKYYHAVHGPTLCCGTTSSYRYNVLWGYCLWVIINWWEMENDRFKSKIFQFIWMAIHGKQDFQYCPFITMIKFCSMGKKYKVLEVWVIFCLKNVAFLWNLARVGKHLNIGCIEGSLCLSSSFVGWVGHCGQGIAWNSIFLVWFSHKLININLYNSWVELQYASGIKRNLINSCYC